MSKVPPINDMAERAAYGRWLLYGESGVGKTLMTATAAQSDKLAPLLVLDIDGGLDSIAHIEGIKYVSAVTEDEGGNKVLNVNLLLSVLNELQKPASQRQKAYQDIKTLAIDSVSALRDVAMKEIVDRDTDSGKRVTRYPQIQDFGQVTYLVTALGVTLRQLKMHVILTAGMDRITSDSGVVIEAAPMLNPKMRQAVGYAMSYIWLMEQTGQNFRLRTLPLEAYRVKTRNPVFAQALADDSVARMVKAGMKPEDAKRRAGWYNISLNANYLPTPGLDYFLDLYLKSIN